jgi:aminoglycoside phosphotransferase (APT) family kinase protein
MLRSGEPNSSNGWSSALAISQQRDADLFRHQLADWLESKVGRPVELTGQPGPAFSGFSNETLLFDAAWTTADGEPRTLGLAVRLEPSGHQVFPDTLFDTQVRVMQALSPTDVKVPEILWHEPDRSVLGAAFFVMRKLTGRVPPDNPPYHVAGWLHEVTPSVRERIWWNGLDAMTAVHRLDFEAAGLRFLDGVDVPRALGVVREYVDWVLQDRPYPLVEEAMDRLGASIPEQRDEPVLCWGDSRIGNVMYDDDGEVVAVMDWEMVTIGDPLADLSWFLLLDRHHSEACGVPRLEGFPSHPDTVARWEAATGRSAEGLSWWMLLGAARYAAVLTRVMDLLEGTGMMPGAKDMAFENTSTTLLRAILDDSA